MQDDDKLYPTSQQLSVGKQNKTNKCGTIFIFAPCINDN